MDTHCKIGRVRLKGPRSVAKRLPLKLIETSLKQPAELADKQREQGRGA